MDEHAEADIVLFSSFRFDRRRGCLSRQNEDGGLIPVTIGARALDVLGILIDRQGDLVSRDEIMDAIWPEMVVEGANVTVQISALRRALDDGRSDASLIQTIPRRGYRLVAAVRICTCEISGASDSPPGEATVPSSIPLPAPSGRELPPCWGLRNFSLLSSEQWQ